VKIDRHKFFTINNFNLTKQPFDNNT